LGSKVIYFAYRVSGFLLFPLVLFYFFVRAVRNPRYWGTLRQRLGFLPDEYQQTAGGAIWFHAVSVGEVNAIAPLLRRVQQLLPGVPVFVSTTTLAGFAAARENFHRQAAGVFYAPVDFVWAVRRVLRRLHPSVVVIAETEIWPNLFRESRRAGAALILVNGRISDSAIRKYKVWRWFFGAALRQASAILVQSEAMRERFLEAGASPESVEVEGNLKFDAEPKPVSESSPVRRFFAGTKVWVAASTSQDAGLAEEDAVLAAFHKLSGWKLLLAPRKPERFAEVARKLERAGVPFVRRTELREDSSGDVLLLDTVGELAGLFALADAVFVGGSLVRRGGHNVLEPAWFGKTITVGPHLENFREIAAEFRAHAAFREIDNAAELAPYVDEAMGERARACAQRNRGATERAALRIVEVYSDVLPNPRRSLPGRLLLTPLAQIWERGGARRRARFTQGIQKLNVPVISVGNITVGGTGKTPTVLRLAQRLSEGGFRPGVLTRGYGRTSPHEVCIARRGGEMSRAHTGDEAQLLLRSGLVALGVGADRAEAGRQLEERGLADVLILDDGFQHARIARDFDLVLIDALAPFGSFQVMPLGRLREPLAELRRASAFLITRVQPGSPVAAIEKQLRLWNRSAPIFRSRVAAQEWRELDGEEERFGATELPFRQTLAFCGLGNPRSFWNTLRELAIEPVESLEYGDHHLYTPREVRRFGQLGRALGVQALLTTEKDAMNLCELTAEAIQPLRLFALRIGVEIEQEDELIALIQQAIRRE